MSCCPFILFSERIDGAVGTRALNRAAMGLASQCRDVKKKGGAGVKGGKGGGENEGGDKSFWRGDFAGAHKLGFHKGKKIDRHLVLGCCANQSDALFSWSRLRGRARSGKGEGGGGEEKKKKRR